MIMLLLAFYDAVITRTWMGIMRFPMLCQSSIWINQMWLAELFEKYFYFISINIWHSHTAMLHLRHARTSGF